MDLRSYEEHGRTFIIAEIAQAHDGSVGILHSLVESAASAGVDAVKFQVHIAAAESSPLEPFRTHFSTIDRTRFDYWKRMELPYSEWQQIKAHCDSLGVEFLASPFSNAAVDLLESLGVERYKVGSGDLNNCLLIRKLAESGKEVILSTGLGTLSELDIAIALLRNRCPYAIFQCTSKYPTAAPDVGLAWLQRLKERYRCPVGLSDHSGKVYAGIGAVALGAVAVEAHITFDRRMFGPDAAASLTIDEMAMLVEGIRFMERARDSGPDKTTDVAKQVMRRMFGKALAVNRSMSAGEEIRFEDLEGKKPADAGIPTSDLDQVIGRTLANDKNQWEFLQQDDLA